ncbi:MAG: class A beta-lactamase-related serine hydrolase [Bacteroidia bacterium]|nr:class A beta-lactamase-related serine hydrolase [Bacteroidia bacterium]
MMRRKQILTLLVGLLLVGCGPDPQDLPLETILREADGVVGKVISDADKFHVQVIRTRIRRDSLGKPSFETEFFRNKPEEYFYPASTVKLPVAVLALERCRELGISPDAPMITDSVETWQTAAKLDSTSPSGYPSVAQYIRKIFLVSDNDAFNRLYEFLGPAYLHRRMTELGFGDTRIVHRLAISLSRRQNQVLNPIYFLGEMGDTILAIPARVDSMPSLIEPSPRLGLGEMRGGKLIDGPKDFSDKNRFNLADQQDFLSLVIFSNGVMGRFLRITEADRDFLIQTMGMLPYESEHPRYDREEYYDSYVKFFLFGDSKAAIPDHIRIYNKIGMAYGFLTDNAYIVDQQGGGEYLLSATIWVNENQVFNDDVYEYDEIGLPFLAKLGQLLTLSP